MNPGISIQRVGKKDAETLASLHKDCFGQAWNTASFAALLDNPNTLAFTAFAKAFPLKNQALILARVAAEEAEILTLGTAPQCRRAGLARLLVLKASRETHAMGAKEMFLEVAVNNEAACVLYSALGFFAAGKRPAYYRSNTENIDALILRAGLPLNQ